MLSKFLVAGSAIAIATILSGARVQAQTCYIVWSNGQTQNLDGLCSGQSVLPTGGIDGDFAPSPLSFQGLDIRPNLDNSGLGRLVGTVQNISGEAVRIDYIEFRLSDSRKGTVFGSVNTRLGVVLQPGQIARISQMFDNDIIGFTPYSRVAVQVQDWI